MIESLIELAMVKAYHFESVGTDEMTSKEVVVPGCVEKLHEYCAAKGIYVCSNFRKLEPIGLWRQYKGDLALRDFVSLSCKHILESASDFERRIAELCEIFGVVLTDTERENENLKYQYLSFLGNIIPQLKYATNLAFSKFLRADLPEGSPSTHMGLKIFPRRLSVRMRMMSNERGRRTNQNWNLMNTVFQGFKKGLLPCEPHIVQGTLDKHRKALSKDPTISEELSNRIDRYCSQLFEKFHIWKEFPDSLGQSTHSTTVVSYSNGGNVGYVRDRLHADVSFDACGKYISGYGLSHQICEPELIGFIAPLGKDFDPDMKAVYSRSYTTLNDMTNVFLDRVYNFRTATDAPDATCLEATPACILEPMKVRLITKPGLGLHVRMHKVQRALRSHIYNELHDIFALSGEPLRRDHLWPIVGRGFNHTEGIVSGDFSAATDNLKGEVTSTIVKNILGDRLGLRDPRLYQNIMSSLQGVRILQEETMVPKYSSGKIFGDGGVKIPNCILDQFRFKLQNFTQTNGQLMGHVISFVVLCVANYCAFWHSWEKFLGSELTLAQMRLRHKVLINGDDILFKSCRDHYNTWLDVIREYGFEPSVGKNYFSDRFLQVNSELWKIDTRLTDELQGCVTQIRKMHYVNFGLLTNRKKQDCSIDCSVSSYFGIDDPMKSLNGRMAAYPSICEKLFEGLDDEIKGRTRVILKRHTNPMAMDVGFDPALLDYIGVEEFNEQFRKAFSTSLGKDPEERNLCGDLSTYLCKTDVQVDCAQLRHLARRIKNNPFVMFHDSLFGIEKEPEIEWFRV